MVKEQIIARGIIDKKVINAMQKVERHKFISESLWREAYEDYPLSIGEDQTISQPYMVGSMTAELKLTQEDKVLEIGTGSGYQTAILAELAKKVYSVERIIRLADEAKIKLDNMGYKNVFIKVGDGSMGLQEYAPYDVILVTAGAKDVPLPLFEQLCEGGRLIIPVGDRWIQTLTKITKIDGKMQEEKLFDCMFVPLLGVYGWQ